MKKGQERCTEDYGISRVDDDKNRSHAWRVSLRRQGRSLVRNFTDRNYGGREQALQEARRYRDVLVQQYPPITRKEVAEIRRSNNRSGIAGVCTYAKRYELANGTVKEYWYWEANWPGENGESGKAIFPVKTYGQDMARQMAINARREGLAAVEGVFWRSERGALAEAGAEETKRPDDLVATSQRCLL